VKGGAELANSAADLILTSESLGLVTKAIDTAHRTRQLVRQNLAWAVLYNVSVMPLAVSGMLKPWMAALGMSLSSLLVVANASRLVQKKPLKKEPLALMLLGVAVWALVWAIRSGQFDDLESHGWSVVLDDDQKPPPGPDDVNEEKEDDSA
jgi:cbb3-type cytochrome oxidase maturation protein